MRPLVWLRVDLRARDNTALHEACARADRGVVALFLISPEEWRDHDESPRKIDYRLRSLFHLSESLAARNIPLLIRTAPRRADIAPTLLEVAREHHCNALFFNAQWEVNEQRRDAEVTSRFIAEGLEAHAWIDETIFPPGELRTGQDNPYTVFTPFKKKWIDSFRQRIELEAHGLPKRQPELVANPDEVPASINGFESDIDPALWPAGEDIAQRRLESFIENRVRNYNTLRDLPAEDGTSRLSTPLNSGVISIRQCLAAALEANNNRLDSGAAGIQTWISELIWREFYRNIIFAFPRVSMNQPFRTETRRIIWSDSEENFAAWCEGQTGYPIVDAAMRQLNATGWMHNRLRMIVAMFLTKDLFIDWRRGERYFMQRLIDGDLASNNGGWQWSASTGTDAAPYFRIFNPVSQSRKCDPEGAFLRRFLPELKDLDNKSIHEPWKIGELARARFDYPDPIVDRAQVRDRVMQAFQNVKT